MHSHLLKMVIIFNRMKRVGFENAYLRKCLLARISKMLTGEIFVEEYLCSSFPLFDIYRFLIFFMEIFYHLQNKLYCINKMLFFKFNNKILGIFYVVDNLITLHFKIKQIQTKICTSTNI